HTLPKFPPETILPPHTKHPYCAGRWFYCELHIGGAGTFGLAGLAMAHVVDRKHVEIRHVFVLENLRRHGVGRDIMLACRRRWPAAVWADTPPSRGWHEKLCAEGIARPLDLVGGYGFASP